jgi:hypothetical protein
MAAFDPGVDRPDHGLFGILGRGDVMLSYLFPLMISLALAAFFWGLGRFIYNSDSDDARENGRYFMIVGVVTLFIMVSVWGIVALIGSELQIGRSGACPPPSINGQVTETCADP